MIQNFYTQPNFYSRDVIDEFNQLYNYTIDGKDNPAEGVSKTCIVDSVTWQNAKQSLTKLEQLAHHTNTNLFGFNILPFTDFDTINLNTYTSDFESEYGWHNDFILADRIYDNKITVIVNISTEDYTGGEFQFFLNHEMTVPDAPGTVIIFPSWTQHRVLPVTSGQRKSLSFWIKGPKLI